LLGREIMKERGDKEYKYKPEDFMVDSGED
jgi:hypothetical protein